VFWYANKWIRPIYPRCEVLGAKPTRALPIIVSLAVMAKMIASVNNYIHHNVRLLVVQTEVAVVLCMRLITKIT